MAIETTIMVAVEKVVHDAMRELAQAVWDQHDVCIRGVGFSWVDISGMGKPKMFITEVDVKTMTKATSRDLPVIPQPQGFK